MITLKIIGIEKNRYLLIDEAQNALYKLFFEFYGITPKINDEISFDKQLLNKKFVGYAQPYAFEVIKNFTEYDESKKIDYAMLEFEGKKVLLRRIYG